MQVVLASSNAGKLRELDPLLRPLGFELIAQTAVGVASPEETGTTFTANALLKARHASAATGLAALADDSGIEVDALGGRPGVYSARYAGVGASDLDNLRKMLFELRDVPLPARGARYRCVIAFLRAPADDDPVYGEGCWEGAITEAPHGSGGFGYDPIFLPSGSTRTAAQLDAGEKNSISHRALALLDLAAKLASTELRSRIPRFEQR